jgi:group I intron endonuclease
MKAALTGLAGIYCVRNIHTGRIYIGSTSELWVRLSCHIRTCSNVHLQRDIIKYGLKNFEFIVVEFVPDITMLLDTEQK